MFSFNKSDSEFMFVLSVTSKNPGEFDLAHRSLRPINPDEEVEVLDEGIDFAGSTMGRIVRWRVVDRGDGRFYQSFFRAEPEEIRNSFKDVSKKLLERALADNSLSESGTCEVVIERRIVSQKASDPNQAQGAGIPETEWAREVGASRATTMQLPQAGKAFRLIIDVHELRLGAFEIEPAIVLKEKFERNAKVLKAGFDSSSITLHRPVLWRVGKRGGRTVIWSSFPARLSEIKALFAESPEAQLQAAFRERRHSYRGEPEMEVTIEAVSATNLAGAEATSFGARAEFAVREVLRNLPKN